MSEDSKTKTEVYKVGAGRKIAFLATFALMMPFFISMPVMIGMRAMHGNFADALSLGIVAVLFAIGLVFLGLQIQAASRTRIELKDDNVNIEVPSWRGPTPMAPFKVAKLKTDDIAAIEERGELYRFFGILGMPRVVSVVKKDGDRVVLGYVNELDMDPPIAFNSVAKTIADRAGVEMRDRGVVNAGSQLGALMRGTPSWDMEALSEPQVEDVRRKTQKFVYFFVAGFLALLIAGIVLALLPEIQQLLGIGE